MEEQNDKSFRLKEWFTSQTKKNNKTIKILDKTITIYWETLWIPYEWTEYAFDRISWHYHEWNEWRLCKRECNAQMDPLKDASFMNKQIPKAQKNSWIIAAFDLIKIAVGLCNVPLATKWKNIQTSNSHLQSSWFALLERWLTEKNLNWAAQHTMPDSEISESQQKIDDALHNRCVCNFSFILALDFPPEP